MTRRDALPAGLGPQSSYNVDIYFYFIMSFTQLALNRNRMKGVWIVGSVVSVPELRGCLIGLELLRNRVNAFLSFGHCNSSVLILSYRAPILAMPRLFASERRKQSNTFRFLSGRKRRTNPRL